MRMRSSRWACLLLVAAVGPAWADTTLPGATRSPRPAEDSAETRWPAVLPCAQPTLIKTVAEHPDDVLRWSSASGAQQRLDHLGDKRPRRLSPTFAGALPTRLVWLVRRPLRPKLPFCKTEESCIRELDLRVACEDGGGQVGWICDDRTPMLAESCYPSVTYAYASAAMRSTYLDVDRRVAQLLRDPHHARDIAVGWGLQLIEDACGAQRCTGQVEAMAAQLKALRDAPAWTGTADERRLHQGRPDARPGQDELVCSRDPDPAIGARCELTFGSIKLAVYGSASGPRHFLGDESAHWFLSAEDDGLSVTDLAMR